MTKVARESSPILVTGVPRSGTTWLARELARSPGTALGGREPMNPRGRQYALGRTVTGWTRLTEPSRGQRRALSTSYRGLNPRVFSRYGHRQWAAPLPWTRVVVKDPFALLSLPGVRAVTGARVVLLYRHPAAVLASYRRMGWSPDLGELAAVLERSGLRDEQERHVTLPAPGEVAEAEAMARFWDALHRQALADAEGLPGLVVVAHEELAAADGGVLDGLRGALGLREPVPTATGAEPANGEPAPTGPASGDQDGRALHRLDRPPEQASRAWHAQVSPEDVEVCERLTVATRARLDALRLRG